MSHRCCDSRGLSLVETLLSAALILFVLGLGASFLFPLFRMQLRGTESAELEQRSAIILEDLRRDLAQTSAAGVTLLQTPDEVLLGIHAYDNVAQDGTLVWKDSLLIHQWSASDGQWRRSVWTDSRRQVLRAGAPTRIQQDLLRQAASQSTPLRISVGVTRAILGAGGSSSGMVSLPLSCQFTVASPTGRSRMVSRTLGGRLPVL